jgi:ABC-type branched-subunit amino acid transport system substrate-binding protein
VPSAPSATPLGSGSGLPGAKSQTTTKSATAPAGQVGVPTTGGNAGRTGGQTSDQGTGTTKTPAHPTGAPVGGSDSQGVTANQVKVGVLAPISGAAAFLGEAAVAGIRGYMGLANSQGGVGGRQYQLVVLDTQFEPTVEATATRRLVDQDKVFSIVSVLGDSAAPYVTSKGIPNFTIGLIPPPYSSKYPVVYPLGPNVVDAVARMAYQLTQVLKKPIKSTAVMYDTQNVPVEPWVKYMAKAWEIWGVQVKSTDRFNLSDADCTQLVVKMRNLNVDFWNLAQSLGWTLCEQAMARQRWFPPQSRGGIYTPDAYFIAQVGPTADGIVGQQMGPQIGKNYGQPWPYGNGGKNPQTDAYVESMKRFSPRNADIRTLESAWAQVFWSAGRLLDESIKAQNGAITWKGVNQWIQGQRAWAGGLLPPANFSPTCKTGGAEIFIYDWKYTGKEFVQNDWQPWGGRIQLPTEAKNKIFPGAGDCYVTAMADAEL